MRSLYWTAPPSSAACFEVTIRFRETHMDEAPKETSRSAFGQFRRELREGVDYIRGETAGTAASRTVH